MSMIKQGNSFNKNKRKYKKRVKKSNLKKISKKWGILKPVSNIKKLKEDLKLILKYKNNVKISNKIFDIIKLN